MMILCIGGPNDGEWHNFPDGRPHLNIVSSPPPKIYRTFGEQLLHNPVDHYDRITVYEKHELRMRDEASVWFAMPRPCKHTAGETIQALMRGYRRPR